MDAIKHKQIFEQYIDQYLPHIHATLNVIRANKRKLLIPYAQFLFSIIDYFGLLYSAATDSDFKKRENNFSKFFSSSYFPSSVTCKASFLYFIRNGIIHQIFPKACSVGVTQSDILFFKDADNGDIPALNLNYLDKITMAAIENFIKDLNTKSNYIESLYLQLIINHYGFNDHSELKLEVKNSFGGDMDKIFIDCK